MKQCMCSNSSGESFKFALITRKNCHKAHNHDTAKKYYMELMAPRINKAALHECRQAMMLSVANIQDSTRLSHDALVTNSGSVSEKVELSINSI